MDKDSKKTSNKDEDRAKKELEFIPKIKEIETKFREIKIKKEYYIEFNHFKIK